MTTKERDALRAGVQDVLDNYGHDPLCPSLYGDGCECWKYGLRLQARTWLSAK